MKVYLNNTAKHAKKTHRKRLQEMLWLFSFWRAFDPPIEGTIKECWSFTRKLAKESKKGRK